MSDMVSYKILSFYHPISKYFAECRINLELLLRTEWFVNIYTKEKVEEFNIHANQAKEYTMKKAEEYINANKISENPKISSNKDEEIHIEVPELEYKYFTKFIDKSIYHSAFSNFETYLTEIIYYIFSLEKMYQDWPDHKKENYVFELFKGRALERMTKIQDIVNLNHTFTKKELSGLDRFLTVRNLYTHNGGKLKQFHYKRLKLDKEKYPVGSEYDSKMTYSDITGLIEFLTYFDKLLVSNYPSFPRYVN